MGKFNKKSSVSNLANEETSVDWSQLISHFENQSVDQAIEKIMKKITIDENVEFDQACLVLKHYLTLKDDKSYLDHFLKFNQSIYFKQVIERFNTNNQKPNVTWMLSELIKLITSACDLEQANYMLSCEQFRTILCVNIFDISLLSKLNKNNTSNRITLVEIATLSNLFETISNLCDINNNLIQFVSQTHIEWMCEAITTIDISSDKDLIVSISRLLHLFTELTKNCSSNQLGEILLDIFTNKNFMANAISNLTLDPNNNTIVSNNLVAKLYLIATLVNLILLNEKVNRSEILSKILQEYGGSLIEYSLNYQLNSLNQEFDLKQAAENENDYKIMIKTVEIAIECKLLSIDIIKSIMNHFVKNDVTEDDCEEEEIIESENENEEEQSEMDTEQDVCMENNDQIKRENFQISSNNLLSPLFATILNDDEHFLQTTDQIEHIYNSINLIKNESSQTCLLIVQYAQYNSQEQNISIGYLIELLKYLLNKMQIDETKKDLMSKLAELCFSLFYNVYNKQMLENEIKLNIINLLKDIFFKFKTDECDLCIELSRILTMIAIKERNTDLVKGYAIIDISAKILLELITASFELNDQSTIQSLKLNAELIDLLIDLFSEDNLKELEMSLNFIDRIKYFSDKFYAKYKVLASKKKLKKDDGLIVKTVRDNLKSFVDYKIQKSK